MRPLKRLLSSYLNKYNTKSTIVFRFGNMIVFIIIISEKRLT